MKNLITILFCLFSLFAEAQVNPNDTTKYFKSFDYGWSYKRLQARDAFILPTDTVINKLGTVSLNGNIYLGNGTKWTSIGGAGTTPNLQQVTTSGATTTNAITVAGLNLGVGTNSANLTASANNLTINSFGTSDNLLEINYGATGSLKFGGGNYTYVEISNNPNSNVNLSAPSTSGTIPMSVNGYTANTAGAITIPIGSNDTTKVPYTGANKNVDLGTKNITANAYFNGFTSMFAKNDTIVLSIDSTPVHLVKGSGGQAYKLPVATTLTNGTIFTFNNNQSSGAINILSNSIANTLVKSVPSGAYLTLELTDNSTPTGIWDAHFQTPSNVSWSTNTLDYAGSITNATWNGNVVAINRGGTGSSTQNFVDLTANQTIAGQKTFSSAIKIPTTGSQLILSILSDGTVASMPTSTYPSPSELAYVKGVTSSIQTQFGNKVNISDTASMLSPYIRTNIANSNFLSKVNVNDTAAMLSPYSRTNVVNASLSTKLNATDTASLSNRINNKPTNLDLLQLMSYGIKAESYGITLANMSGQQSLTTNRFYLYPFNWNVSDSIRGVAFFNRAAFTNVALNYNGIAIYSLSGSTLTRVLQTANDGTFWNSTINTWSTKTLTPTFLTKGIYFIGYQFSGTGTPTMGAGDPLVIASTQSPSDPPSAVNSNGIKFSTFIANTTSNAPTSIAMSATTAVVNVPYFIFY